jgi:hypothetical protein
VLRSRATVPDNEKCSDSVQTSHGVCAEGNKRWILKFHLEQIKQPCADQISRINWGFVGVFWNELKTSSTRITSKNYTNTACAMIKESILPPINSKNHPQHKNSKVFTNPQREGREERENKNDSKNFSGGKTEQTSPLHDSSFTMTYGWLLNASSATYSWSLKTLSDL